MPGGLVVANRVLRIASDDFVVPSIIGISVHTIWLLWSISLWYSKDQLGCEVTWVEPYLLLVMLLQACEIFIDGAILLTTLRGTVADSRPRRALGTILLFSTLLKSMELVLLDLI